MLPGNTDFIADPFNIAFLGLFALILTAVAVTLVRIGLRTRETIARGKADGEIKTGLMVLRIGVEPGHEFGEVASTRRLFQKLDGGQHALDRGMPLLVGGYELDGLAGADRIAAFQIALGKAGKCIDNPGGVW